MSQTAAEWAIHHEGVIFSAQRAQADTAKVLVGLTLAVSATLVGTALQVPPVTVLDVLACGLLAVTLGLSVVTIGLDRVEPCRRENFRVEALRNLDAEARDQFIRRRLERASQRNDYYLVWIGRAAVAQVASASLASVSAVLGLVVPQ